MMLTLIVLLVWLGLGASAVFAAIWTADTLIIMER